MFQETENSTHVANVYCSVQIIALPITQKLPLQLGCVCYRHLPLSTLFAVALNLSKLHVPHEDRIRYVPKISGSVCTYVNYLPLTAYGGISESDNFMY
jgi:hypothetical protein